MRSVVKGVNATLRLTSWLPVTLASVTQFVPSKPCTVKSVMPRNENVMVSEGSTGVEVVVLHRVDDDAVDAAQAAEGDLQPVGELAEAGVVPAAAGFPAGPAALVVDGGARRKARTVGRRRRGHAAVGGVTRTSRLPDPGVLRSQ